MNYRFHLDEWLRRFPLEERYGRYHAELITSPWHLCQNEQLRRELRNQYELGRAVPMDVFIMAEGEPPDRSVTKIGGLPYRPTDAAWPTRKTGIPLVFLAQFNFSDSKDLTGELPDDVLLVFTDNVNTPTHLHFEWRPLGLSALVEARAIPKSTVVMDPAASTMREQFISSVKQKFHELGMKLPAAAEEIPEPTNEFSPCYGYIYRTLSYPDSTRIGDPAKYPTCRGTDVWSADYYLFRYQATQIGAAPFFIQPGDPDCIEGRLLCTLSSFAPAADVAYPWINRREPIPAEKMRGLHNCLNIGDAGCIYISIDERNNVHGHWSSY